MLRQEQTLSPVPQKRSIILIGNMLTLLLIVELKASRGQWQMFSYVAPGTHSKLIPGQVTTAKSTKRLYVGEKVYSRILRMCCIENAFQVNILVGHDCKVQGVPLPGVFQQCRV